MLAGEGQSSHPGSARQMAEMLPPPMPGERRPQNSLAEEASLFGIPTSKRKLMSPRRDMRGSRERAYLAR